MTERIKLTSKNIRALPGRVLIECEKSQPIRQQMLDDSENAEKYEDLMNANSEVVQGNISLTQLHQENKLLKDELEKRKTRTIKRLFNKLKEILDEQKIKEIKN